MKKCSKCFKLKELTEFYKNKSGKLGVHHYCKLCNSIQKHNSYNYEKAKGLFLKYKYGITKDKVEEMFLNQNKKCKICNTKYNKVSQHRGLYIDHNHKNGAVRGLLCNKCNKLLGNCNDSILLLKSAIKYLFDYD